MENNRYREEEKDITQEENFEDNKGISDEEVGGEKTESFEEEKLTKKQKKNRLIVENEALKAEIESLKDQLLRERAELENFKRRTNEERIKDRKYALTDFLMELIDVVDIFDKAVNVKTDDEKLKKFLSGFEMVNKTFKQILSRNGVEQIESIGKPFDPSYHSAIETVQKEGVEPNIVVEEIMTGYTYKDRVLRPSMVKVSE